MLDTGSQRVRPPTGALVFPDRAEGWFNREDAQALFDAAYGADFAVELGTYKGRSTIVLAQAVRRVLTIDHFQGAPTIPAGYRPALEDNLAHFGMRNRIRIHQGPTDMPPDGLPPVDVLFIDADHDRALADFTAWRDLLAPSSVVVFHDRLVGDVPDAIALAEAEGFEHESTTYALEVLRRQR